MLQKTISNTQKEEGPSAVSVEQKDRMFNVGNVDFKMIHIDGDTFTMGATDETETEDGDEKPAHQVTLSSYFIGETPVTQALWKAVMDSNPSCFDGDRRPVDNVSWSDCQTFISRLNQLTGKEFRLPTEAEWEFAARGGDRSKGHVYAGSNDVDEVAWYWKNSGCEYLHDSDDEWDDDKLEKNRCSTHDVATKKLNELGIYDMSGNVWEWCQDWYRDYSGDLQTNPTGPASGSDRVIRGGCWGFRAETCRVSFRFYKQPKQGNYLCGLRLALSE